MVLRIGMSFLMVSLLLPGAHLNAQENNYAALEAKVQLLEQQLTELRKELHKNSVAVEDLDVAGYKQLSARVDDLQTPADTAVHLAGYGAYDFVSGDSQVHSVGDAFFRPIFHYQYRDLLLFETELEFELGENGQTETGVEYVSLDLFLNDYVTLVGGKFLSPIGQFQQNLHPSWINKLPTKPLGFGHDQAQPDAEVGFQLRGGFRFNDRRLNFATYLGNGPRAALVEENGRLEIHALESVGFPSDPDGESVIGGRIGFLPVYNIEVGISAATGKAGLYLGDSFLQDEEIRNYDVISADLYWQWNQFQFRSEYVKQKLGGASSGLAPQSMDWTGWYSQGAYRFPLSPWEAVVRYSEFDAPEKRNSQQQWMLGVNYLYSSNLLVKLAAAFNDGVGGDLSDNRLLFQMTYGF